MSGPETKLQKKIKLALEKEVGGWWIKIHGAPYQKRGLPDLHGTVQSLSIWIEVKVPGKEDTLTELQKQCIKSIKFLGGGLSFMTTSPEHAVKIVKRYLKDRDNKLITF